MKTRQTVAHVPVEHLREHPANIRDDLGDLTEMGLSIKEHGILQPLTATEDPEHDGKLLLLAGHRRLGGAILAKLDVVPVIIRHGLDDPCEQLVVMLVENTQRRDLNPVERAQAYGALQNQGLSMSEIARRTGTHPSTVSYYLNFLMLDPYEQEMVRTGELAATKAVAEVRERRQEARAAADMPLRGRPKSVKKQIWFSGSHRLADQIRSSCTHRARPQVGANGASIGGCGPCWEAAIRAEAEADWQAAIAAAEAAEEGRRVAAIDGADKILIQRVADGDFAAAATASLDERHLIVDEFIRRGLSLNDLERHAGWKPERYGYREAS